MKIFFILGASSLFMAGIMSCGFNPYPAHLYVPLGAGHFVAGVIFCFVIPTANTNR